MTINYYIIKRKTTQFLAIIVYMELLNVIFWMIGSLFMDSYGHWTSSHMDGSELFFISLFAFIQIFVFPIDKKYRIIVVAWLYLTLGLVLTHNDYTNFGGEIWSIIYRCISQFNNMLAIFFVHMENEFLMDLNEFLFFPLYLILVGYSFRYLYSFIGRKIGAIRNKNQ